MTQGVPTGGYRDLLLFLAMAGVVAPLFKRFKISPVLGFLLGGGRGAGPLRPGRGGPKPALAD